MGLSRLEQETVISFNAEEGTADIYTADPAWIRKMDKLLDQNPEQFKLVKQEYYNGKVIAKRYTFPKRFLTIRTKDKNIILTDEQRDERRKRILSSIHRRTPQAKDIETPLGYKLPSEE